MDVRPAQAADHAAIVAILNHAIETSSASFRLRALTDVEQVQWIEKLSGPDPLFVAVEAERVLGFAYYLPYRAYAGYASTRETTVYVAADAQGRGVGSALYARLITHARASDVHSLVAVVTAGNQASAALHQRHGFRLCGHLDEVAHKQDRWWGEDHWQLML